MTERKPPGMSFDTWVERRIRQAAERGEFADLPGAGRPLPRRIDGELGWVARKLEEENLDATALLPPSLALPKEVERLPEQLVRQRDEREVRRLVEALNERIRRAHAAPQAGPPLRLGPLDVEAVVRTWRESRRTNR